MNFPSTFSDVQRVGSGGLGDVYFARRVSSDTDVAIKVLRQTHGQEAVLRRANREREALASLRGHPNVVHLEEVAESSEGEILLVMEYMAGGSVDTFAGYNGTLLIDEVLLVGESAANALSAAHGRGIVHRDIKPQNLLVNGFGNVKVCDFGISSLGASAEYSDRTDALSYRFASPEEIRGDMSVGPLTDVYSLGVTLAFLLTGGYVNHELASTLLEYDVTGAETDGVEAEFRSVLVQCLAVNPRDRPDSETLARRLGALGESLGPVRARRLVRPAAERHQVGRPGQQVTPVVPSVAAVVPQPDLPASGGQPTSAPPAVAPPISHTTPAPAQVHSAAPPSGPDPRHRRRGQRLAVFLWVLVAILLVVLALVVAIVAGVFDAPDVVDDPSTSPAAGSVWLELS